MHLLSKFLANPPANFFEEFILRRISDFTAKHPLSGFYPTCFAVDSLANFFEGCRIWKRCGQRVSLRGGDVTAVFRRKVEAVNAPAGNGRDWLTLAGQIAEACQMYFRAFCFLDRRTTQLTHILKSSHCDVRIIRRDLLSNLLFN